MNRIILASQSPRRRELLQRIVSEFEIIPARGEERSGAQDPRDYVRELAQHKAREVMQTVSSQNQTDHHGIPTNEEHQIDRQSATADAPDESDSRGSDGADQTLYVIGADTIVVCNGEIMGKPHDREDAYRMIHQLQGHSHEVMTGVCVLRRAAGVEGGPILQGTESAVGAHDGIAMDAFTCVTEVTVAPMTDAEIRHYLATGEADDKAGAYGIQGAFSLYVTGIHGSYSNVVGLPVAAVYQSMQRLGWKTAVSS